MRPYIIETGTEFLLKTLNSFCVFFGACGLDRSQNREMCYIVLSQVALPTIEVSSRTLLFSQILHRQSGSFS
jgi:hypothetical protein